MHKPHFTHEQLALVAKLSDSDIKKVNEYRGTQNKLEFAYQFCHVKLFNGYNPTNLHHWLKQRGLRGAKARPFFITGFVPL